MKKVTPLAPLTAKESERLRICTETVLEGLQKSFDAGVALIEVRDHKLYREKFSTFKEFCEEVFKISKQRAYQLIEATVIKESLPAKAAKHIVNESQARALADVPEEDRAKVVIEAAKSGAVTAGSINEAASQKSTTVDSSQTVKTGNASTVPAKIVLDETGWEIPKDRHALWARRGEVREMLAQITNIENRLLQFQKDEDEVFGIINFSSAVSKLQFAHMEIKNAQLYAVCTSCQGRNYAKCKLCKGRGILSKFTWDSAVPEEIKAIRKKGSKV